MSASALRHLSQSDPVLRDIIDRVGPYKLKRRAGGSHYAFVARAIVFQQLSVKAAGTIWSRFEALFPDETPDAALVPRLQDARLRSAGLSRQKISYLRDLSKRVSEGELPLQRIARLDDEAAIDALTSVKGVGRWTAQMFLIFRLGRPDVLPDGDLGIQNAIAQAYRLKDHPMPAKVREIGGPWAPYRSVASWYLWRSLDGEAAL